MSYDFELYTSKHHELELLPIAATSSVVVDGPNFLEEEDIPAVYLSVVGKRRSLYRIHIEGDINAVNQNALDNWLRELVIKTKGVLIDLQTNKFETIKKSGEIESKEKTSDNLGRMSFYFVDGESFYDTGFEKMLECITKNMPEASPKRFGSYEPLQRAVEGEDDTDLIAAFHKEPELIMKSQAPFGHISMSIPCRKTFESYHPQHYMRREFLLGYVEFELRPKIFSDPSVLTRLKNLFSELCVLLDVTYAEILTEDRVGPNWRWYGLIDTKPETLCVGSTYEKVWPEIQNFGQKIGLKHRVVSTDRFGKAPPCPPAELIAPNQLGKNPGEEPEYAAVFPFDYSYDYNKYVW